MLQLILVRFSHWQCACKGSCLRKVLYGSLNELVCEYLTWLEAYASHRGPSARGTAVPGAGRSPSSSCRVQGAGYVTTLNTRCSVFALKAITCAGAHLAQTRGVPVIRQTYCGGFIVQAISSLFLREWTSQSIGVNRYRGMPVFSSRDL